MHKLKLFLLSVLLVFSNNVLAQRTINWYRVLTDTAQLNYNPFSGSNTIKMGYYNINPKTGQEHRHVGNGVWVEDSLFKQEANSLIVNGTSIDYSPEQFGAVRQNVTFSQLGITQSTINTNYPGIGATVADNVDWAAWQMAIKIASSQGGCVKAKGGTYYIGSKPITIEKYSKDFQIDGNYCKIISTGSVAVFNRPAPNDNGDANVMIALRFTIKNIWVKGTSSQIGFDLGPTYGAMYESIHCEDMDEAIHTRFALKTVIQNCFATDCNKGWTFDKGNWVGASNSNSQSNVSIIRDCRYYTNLIGDYGIAVKASSGCIVENCIVEGNKVRVGIDFDAQSSTVVKDFTVRGLHLECTNGTTEACIKIRIAGGVITIEKVFGQYAGILVDAATQGGYPYVRISNIPWWIKLTGKAFNNSGCSWEINSCDAFQTNTPSTFIPTLFNGTVPQLCGGPGCGSNRFFYTGIPR